MHYEVINGANLGALASDTGAYIRTSRSDAEPHSLQEEGLSENMGFHVPVGPDACFLTYLANQFAK